MKCVALIITYLLSVLVAGECTTCHSLPRRHPGQVLTNTAGSCPSTQEAVNQVSADLDTIIDSLLPQLQASLSPSPCEGLGWTQVANLDMTNSSHSCPQGWVNDSIPGSNKRLCRRPAGFECTSVFFSTQELQYNQVCGLVRAYQYGSTDAFQKYTLNQDLTLDDAFMDGVVISRGGVTQREHVWTFAAGLGEVHDTDEVCPCVSSMPEVPPFVGSNYFCESGVVSHDNTRIQLYKDDPLWDGTGCRSTNNCCARNNPPYFSAALPTASCDDLEVRICAGNRGEEDVPLERIELYVK
ncbi:uncharacterized protein LOC135341960 [Halichondria panicea]|uniref:uncharacterized protein LOC135341960 n=1 Tax=Halichondria panicea TaxID=6063 RepID=UPI00312BBF33